jgi:hypothetical protein
LNLLSADASLRAEFRYSDFKAVVFSPRAKLDYTTSKAGGFWTQTKSEMIAGLSK